MEIGQTFQNDSETHGREHQGVKIQTISLERMVPDTFRNFHLQSSLLLKIGLKLSFIHAGGSLSLSLSLSDVAVLILSSPEFNPFSLLRYLLFIYHILTFPIGLEE